TRKTSSCLRKSARQFAATFARLGKACPGASSTVGTLIDDFCVSPLSDGLTPGSCILDTQGCSRLTALGAAGREFMVCAAKAVANPDSLSACTASLDTSLNA